MINYRRVKVFIVIISSVLYLSCSNERDTTANASGKDIVFEYYRSFPGTEEIDFQYKKGKILKLQTEILKKLRELQKKIRDLYKDCPEACVNEKNALELEVSVYHKKMNNTYENFFKIKKQEISQSVILLAIHKSIENRCGHSDRVDLYDKFIKRASADLDEKVKKELEFLDVDSLFNTIYIDANTDINTGEFIIDCSWETLDIFEKTVTEKMALMKSAKKTRKD